MPFGIGETVGPYQIIQQLGQGGMATVYKAYHAALDRYVAIKALHPAFMDDPSFLSRFQREARVVARLEHPNIVPIFDYAEHEGRPYLVMKYIEGETLKASLERSALPPAEILRVVEAVGSALSYAHQRGILHRDVKPSNVLMAADGQIYLADFGLARIAQSGELSLTSDRMVGTPQYISPEQAMSRPDLDARTDIYSLGVMVYEMVVGRVPFSADTPFAVIHDHIYSPLPPPRTINPAVSLAMERVLLKALAKDPPGRFCEAMEFVRAFRVAVNPATDNNPPQPDLVSPVVPADERATLPAATMPPATQDTAGMAEQDLQGPASGLELPAVGNPAAALQDGMAATLEPTTPPGAGDPVEPSLAHMSPPDHPLPAPPAPPLPESVSGSVPPPAALDRRQRPTCLRGCFIGGLILAVLMLVLVVGLGWFKNRVDRNKEVGNLATGTAMLAEAQTQVAALMETQPNPNPPGMTPPPVNPMPSQISTPAAILNASKLLDKAIEAWRDRDWQLMKSHLSDMVTAAGQDRAFYEYAYQVIAEQGAWRLGYQLAYHPPEPLPYDLRKENSDAHRRILYNFALDPGFAAETKAEKDIPLFRLAQIRHLAYSGELAAAREQFTAFMERPAVRTDFPEVQLLEAELSILEGDPEGQNLLNNIVVNEILPLWVRSEADLMIKNGLPQIRKP